jgi:ABC-type transport system involved in multi-copper enzyme maturation permease subunit
MWLVTTLIAAIAVTVMWLALPKNRYKLDFLALMMWGASLMILVDHVLGYEGGEFIQMETEGMITNGIVLGIAMIIPIFIIWGIALLIERRKLNAARS